MRRIVKGTAKVLAVLVVLVAVVAVWIQLTPWPGAMVVRAVFASGAHERSEKNAKFAPDDVTVTSDVEYSAGSSNQKLDVYQPNVRPDHPIPIVVWVHGGGWLSGDKSDDAVYFKLLSQAGYVVVAPNYALAPDSPYPAAIHDLNAAFDFVSKNAAKYGGDANKIFLAGDSAGSNLSAQMAAIITNPDYANQVGVKPSLRPDQLAGMVLTCGIYQMERLAEPGPQLATMIPFAGVIEWGDKTTVWAYAGTEDFGGPVVHQMSPYYFVNKDFPTTFMTGGNADPLTNGQSVPLADQLDSLGVSVTRLFYPKDHEPKLPHEYQFNLDIADGQNALKAIIEFLNKNSG